MSNPEKRLYDACKDGDVGKVRSIIQRNRKINLNERTESGEPQYTPLGISCKNGHLDVIEELLKHPSVKPKYFGTRSVWNEDKKKNIYSDRDGHFTEHDLELGEITKNRKVIEALRKGTSAKKSKKKGKGRRKR